MLLFRPMRPTEEIVSKIQGKCAANSWLTRRAAGPFHLEVDFVLGLPAESLPRRGRGQAEQNAGVELERTRAEVVDRAKHLRSDAMVLCADRNEMADRPRLAIGLEAGLDDPSGGNPRLPGIAEAHSAGAGELADLLGEKQVDRIDRGSDLLAQQRSELDLVGCPGDRRVPVFDEKGG